MTVAKSDWELIQACRQKDTSAWQVIIERYERLVLAIPMRYGLTRDDAEDVAQATFTNLFESLKSFHRESNVKAWLVTVAKRNSWRVLAHHDREQVNSAENLTESALILKLITTDEVQDWTVIERLHAGLNALDERCRNLLAALYFDPTNLSYDEIAVQFNMARNSVGAIRSRCLKRLRKQFDAGA